MSQRSLHGPARDAQYPAKWVIEFKDQEDCAADCQRAAQKPYHDRCIPRRAESEAREYEHNPEHEDADIGRPHAWPTSLDQKPPLTQQQDVLLQCLVLQPFLTLIHRLQRSDRLANALHQGTRRPALPKLSGCTGLRPQDLQKKLGVASQQPTRRQCAVAVISQCLVQQDQLRRIVLDPGFGGVNELSAVLTSRPRTSEANKDSVPVPRRITLRVSWDRCPSGTTRWSDNPTRLLTNTAAATRRLVVNAPIG